MEEKNQTPTAPAPAASTPSAPAAAAPTPPPAQPGTSSGTPPPATQPTTTPASGGNPVKSSKKLFIIVFGLLIIVGLLVAGAFAFNQMNNKDAGQAPTPTLYDVPRGS